MSGDQWQAEQVAPLQHIRHRIQVPLDNTYECSPAGAHFLGDCPHAFAGILFDNLVDELGRPAGTRPFLINLAFWPEIAIVVLIRICP